MVHLAVRLNLISGTPYVPSTGLFDMMYCVETFLSGEKLFPYRATTP